MRLPTVAQVDFRVDRPVTIARVKATLSIDVFNLLDANTILSQRRQQNATNANTVSAILAPRVLRFGVRMTW